MIHYTIKLGGRAHNARATKVVRVSLNTPDWWPDATASERRVMERKALDDAAVHRAQASGLVIFEIIRPRCECVVNQVEHLDPYWRGARGCCNRCGGPIKRKGKRKRGD